MKHLLFFLAVTFLITSCKVAFVPTRSDTTIALITQGQHATDSLYDAMNASNDKSYSTFSSGYDAVQNDITALTAMEATRNKTIASQVATLQTHFNYYRMQHQTKGSLNDAEITTFKNDMDALWAPIYNSENFLK